MVSRATESCKNDGGREKEITQNGKSLHERIVGQDEAVSLVCDTIRRSRAGLADPGKPCGSFIFGPNGVGKTELCKALAGFLFDSESHLIRVDMSEYMENTLFLSLLGSTCYVGYDQEVLSLKLFVDNHTALYCSTRLRRHIQTFLIFCSKF